MDNKTLTEIYSNAKDKSNKTLFEARDFLIEEHEKTKQLIIDLTRHLDTVEEYYEGINKEIGNRTAL